MTEITEGLHRTNITETDGIIDTGAQSCAKEVESHLKVSTESPTLPGWRISAILVIMKPVVRTLLEQLRERIHLEEGWREFIDDLVCLRFLAMFPPSLVG